MRRTRLSIKKNISSNNTVNNCEKAKKKLKSPNRKNEIPTDDSSSESDIESYLKPVHEIDLNSSFFQSQKSEESQSFSTFENKFFSGINRLSDSESEVENEERNEGPIPTTSKINFNQLHEYTKKIEEAKEVVNKYEANKKYIVTKQTRNKVDDISTLLALGETKVPISFEKKLQKSNKSDESLDFESHSESENDWEEVEENTLKMTKTNVPKEGVQITVQLPDVMRKKKGVDLIASMKRRLNRIRKENQVLVHKVHLLCWLGHGNYVNTVLNNNGLLAMALSLIPSQHCYPAERTDLKYLEQIAKWYHNTIPNVEKLTSKTMSLEKLLKLQITRKQAYNKQMMVYIFICILRALGIQCRLVLSFQVAPIRPPISELHSLSTKNDHSSPSKNDTTLNTKTTTKKVDTLTKNDKSTPNTKTNTKKVNTPAKNDKNTTPNIKTNMKKVNTPVKNDKNITPNIKTATKKIDITPQKCKNTNTSSTANTDKVSAKKPNLKKLTNTLKQSSTIIDLQKEKPTDTTIQTKEKLKIKQSNKQKLENNNKDTIVPQVDGVNDSDTETKKHKSNKKPNLKQLSLQKTDECPKNHPKRLKSLPNYIEINSEDEFEPKASTSVQKAITSNLNLKKLRESKSTQKKINNNAKAINIIGDVKNDIISIMKKRITEEKEATQAKLVKNRRKRRQSDDSDYVPDSIKKKPQDSDEEFIEKTKIKVKQRVKTRKHILQEERGKEKKGVDVWVEVFLECEEKWISADVTKGTVHCISELYSRASHPISYIVAWNNDNSIKDITQRYCPNWNTTTRKLRISKNWWEQSLKPFKGKTTPRDKEEDEELAKLQLEKPLPTSIAEYKNHPLYALKRHLLKFEAIYPEDAITLGFVRKEPVYSRDCVHTLHSREIWIKHAKVVKPGEKPYKIVKSRPKYDKLSGKMVSDLPLEVFGTWQIEDYVPPTAENGIIPRNAYGNVDLFKSCMLPKGTVHLQLPGLNKVAKKMNIDCASAVTGFDFHSGWSHPTFDGFVVCEEFQDQLIAAWYMEQEEQEKREQEKIEKRVYDNWKKLIKGLLIRERLKAKYDYGTTSKADTQGKKRKSKGPKLPTKKCKTVIQIDSDDD